MTYLIPKPTYRFRSESSGNAGIIDVVTLTENNFQSLFSNNSNLIEQHN